MIAVKAGLIKMGKCPRCKEEIEDMYTTEYATLEGTLRKKGGADIVSRMSKYGYPTEPDYVEDAGEGYVFY